jgi:predicted ribosomally synthesized peptide with nif11-like leader
MSIESAKAFIGTMNTDEDFAKGVIGCKDSESRRQFIKGKGFDFTMDELSQARNNEKGEELGDEILESISGGLWLCGLGDYSCSNVPD